MSTMIPSFMSRSLALGAALVASAFATACNDSGSGEPGPEALPAAPEVAEVLPTAILVDLPSGIEISLNGRARGVTPLAAMEVEPGTYTVTLVAGCKTMHVPLDVRAHETEKIDLASAAELGLVSLEITAKDKNGKPLDHTVSLDDEVLGGGKGTSKTLVPPCKARLKVGSEGLGGFIEDIDFGKENAVKREIALLPGPDLVRLHGGPFTPGSGGKMMTEPDCFPKPYYKVEVKSFDIDRTEVTVEQWLACRKAGGCPSTLMKWSVTKKPHEVHSYPQCNVEVLSDAKEPPVRSGKEKFPMNCIAHWEADDYCRWAGKRLATDVEWEFAARSGRSDYTFPWGNDYSPCANDIDEGACLFGNGTPREPCSYPEMNTMQGVCDMANNLYEMVSYDEFPGRRKKNPDYGPPGPWEEPENRQYRIGDAYSAVGSCMLSIDGFWEEWSQYPLAGFRCVRDNGATPSRG
jgi:formylglycine-generating enzyme required for sulfatase activity